MHSLITLFPNKKIEVSLREGLDANFDIGNYELIKFTIEGQPIPVLAMLAGERFELTNQRDHFVKHANNLIPNLKSFKKNSIPCFVIFASPLRHTDGLRIGTMLLASRRVITRYSDFLNRLELSLSAINDIFFKYN